MAQFNITGMSCAACSARVEKAVSAIDGVDECSVNLLTNSMEVSGSASTDDIISAVIKAGYGASEKGSEKRESNTAQPSNTETASILKRLACSLVFLLLLMYVSMGHVMWGLPLFFGNNPLAVALVQMILTVAVMIINSRFFTSGFKGLFRGAPNMDTLVALGSAAAFVYSTFVIFAMTAQSGDELYASLHNLYFESSAMILTLITVGKMLEARAKGKTTDALKALMNLAPKTATILRDGKEVALPTGEVQKGDVFVVRPGESIPCDGVIVFGGGAVDESALTGESIPIDKKVGDKVYAATINKSGFLKCEATAGFEDTTFSAIIKMVSDAAATKAPIAKMADKVSGVFVPIVMGIAVLTFGIWMILGQTVGYALARGISVLVISCPCALGLATPVAIMVASGVGAKHGILFKSAAALEQTGKIKVVALDKTGTVTKGKPSVADVLPSKISAEELLLFAASLEAKSEHPLGKAVVEYAISKNANLFETDAFEVISGKGLKCTAFGKEIVGGSLTYVSEFATVSKDDIEVANSLASDGKTPMFFCRDKEFIGIIAVADTVKEDSHAAILQLKKLGIRTVMLTGDNELTAAAIAKRVGINEVRAGVLPANKAEIVGELAKSGAVAMIGDGINDAVALTSADVGIAIGAGADVAIDAADVVLMHSSLLDAVCAIKLSRKTLRNIRENLFWAFFYNVIGIPLAAGAFIPLFALEMSPMFGAAAMSISSFCVVMNALRLNLFKNDCKNGSVAEIGAGATEITVKIKGMMCSHCSSAVKKCLEALDEVDEAVVSHTEGTAILKLNSDLSDAKLKKTIKAEGYQVI